MAVFGGLVITNEGKKLEAKVQTGKLLKFKKIVLGDGELGSSESMISITNLKHKVIEREIFSMKIIQDNIAKITFVLTNTGLTEGFIWREIGIIAEDPDTEEEILYCYGNARENGEYISAEGSSDILEKFVSVDINITNTENVSAIINESLIFVDQEQFEQTIKSITTHKYHMDVTAQINSGTNITLPFYYEVGSNCMDVYLYEHLLFKTTDTKEGNYKEIGTVGSISNIIQLDGTSGAWSVPAGYYFDFVVRGEYNAS